MGQLDISPLRSLVAVAEFGGFQRAADQLHLSQAAVSQHVRRLERAVGRPLVERHGRGSRFTTHGEALLVRARQIVALHDETLGHFGGAIDAPVVVGTTEHAAAQILPFLSRSLEEGASGHRYRFRIDRGSRLREGLTNGTIDLALLLNASDNPDAVHVGDLALTWYAGPTWRPPTGGDPVPVVVFDNPCALRTQALETLAAHAIPAVIGAEAIQLAGVQAAVRAGLGVALMATLGETPEGLTPCGELPSAGKVALFVCARRGADENVPTLVADVLRPLLASHALPFSPPPEAGSTAPSVTTPPARRSA